LTARIDEEVAEGYEQVEKQQSEVQGRRDEVCSTLESVPEKVSTIGPNPCADAERALAAAEDALATFDGEARGSWSGRVVNLWARSWTWLVWTALLLVLAPGVPGVVSSFLLMPVQGSIRSRLLYDWSSPFISFAAGLYGLSRITGDGDATSATLATPDDPDSYLMRIDFEGHPGLVMRPRHVVGVIGTPDLRTRWRWGIQSLATWQVRYIMLAGSGIGPHSWTTSSPACTRSSGRSPAPRVPATRSPGPSTPCSPRSARCSASESGRVVAWPATRSTRTPSPTRAG